MKNIPLLILAAALASPVYALTWTDTVTDGVPLYMSSGGTTSYQRNFTITDNGYAPATMKVTSFTVKFWFADDDPGISTPDGTGGDSMEYVDLFVNGVLVANDFQVDGAHPVSSYAEYSFNILNDANGLITALQDGSVSFKVQLVSGDTYLKQSQLIATGDYITVPDGGTTAALLGLALLGLVAATKRLGLKL